MEDCSPAGTPAFWGICGLTSTTWMSGRWCCCLWGMPRARGKERQGAGVRELQRATGCPRPVSHFKYRVSLEQFSEASAGKGTPPTVPPCGAVAGAGAAQRACMRVLCMCTRFCLRTCRPPPLGSTPAAAHLSLLLPRGERLPPRPLQAGAVTAAAAAAPPPRHLAAVHAPHGADWLPAQAAERPG